MRKSICAKIVAFVLLAVATFTFVISFFAAIIVFDDYVYNRDAYSVTRSQVLDETLKSIYKQDTLELLRAAVYGENKDYLKNYEMGNDIAIKIVPTEGEPKFFGFPDVYETEGFDTFEYKYRVNYPAIVESSYDLDAQLNIPYVYDVTLLIGKNHYIPREEYCIDATMFVFDNKGLFIPACIVSALIALGCFIFLVAAAGHVKDEEKKPGFFVRIPLDIYLVGMFVVGGIIAAVTAEWAFDLTDYPVNSIFELIATLAVAAMISTLPVLITAVIMNLKSRVMLGNFWKNTVVYMCIRWLFKLCKKLAVFTVKAISKVPYVWKTLIALGGFNLLLFIFAIVCAYDSDFGFVMFLLVLIVGDVAMLYFTLMLKRLKESAEQIAQGGDAAIDIKYMVGDLKSTAFTLENIKSGIDAAVGEKMKSERMKTALITNVSHDIKTPLTSIINYSDLIGEEECDNEKIKEYAEVLHRQSERLKKLIEDLIEASKASSGSLEVSAEPLDLGILTEQVTADYEDKLANAGLELVVNKSDSPLMVMADGRRMWRVLDNILNNACKYSMKGTRVYLDVAAEDGYATVSLKNISAAKLNMKAEELIERFARGDESRTAEGNGLGLAIANDLTRLQGGELRILVDGDLFKAEVKMKLI